MIVQLIDEYGVVILEEENIYVPFNGDHVSYNGKDYIVDFREFIYEVNIVKVFMNDN